MPLYCYSRELCDDASACGTVSTGVAAADRAAGSRAVPHGSVNVEVGAS